MINPTRLAALSVAGSHDDLALEALGSWRRRLPLGARLRLSAPETAASAAAGLALVRLAELTHVPGAAVRRLHGRLVRWLEDEAEHETPDAVALASAAAGLLAIAAQPGADADLRASSAAGAAKAIDLLGDAAARLDPALGGDNAMTGALSAWLLAPAATGRTVPAIAGVVAAQATRDARVVLAKLCRSLDDAGAGFDPSLSVLLERAASALGDGALGGRIASAGSRVALAA